MDTGSHEAISLDMFGPGRGSLDVFKARRIAARDTDVTCPTMHLRKSGPATKAPTRFPSRIPDGAVLGERYKISGVLGSGGFADVYCAEDLTAGVPVAVKVLRFIGGPDIQRNAEARFLQDAQVAARIDHPNVVRILSFHETMSLALPDREASVFRRLYIVMELLEGHTVQDELAEKGKFDARRALGLMLGALEGLAVGHQAGIVHKDLKPGNLFITHPGEWDERLTIVDFGVARQLGSEHAGLTNPGDTFCTPRYAAPEYLKDGMVTPALDVYQMGLVLAEMLTGEKVVKGKGLFECTMEHRKGVTLEPVLDQSFLGPMLRRALDKDPNARYADAGTFHQALRWRCASVFK